MRLMLDLARGLAESIRETLPGDTREMAVFLAAMAWSFILFWVSLIVASVCSARAMGQPL